MSQGQRLAVFPTRMAITTFRAKRVAAQKGVQDHCLWPTPSPARTSDGVSMRGTARPVRLPFLCGTSIGVDGFPLAAAYPVLLPVVFASRL